MMLPSKHFIKIGKIILAIALGLLLLSQVEWKTFFTVIAGIKLPYVFLYLLLQVVAIFLSVKKWSMVARARNIHFALSTGTHTYLLGMFLNNFFPSTVGGDVYRSKWLAEYSSISFRKAFYTVFFERLQGLWLLILIIALFPVFQFTFVAENFLLVLFSLGATFFIVACLALFWLLQKGKISALTARFSGRLRSLIEQLEKDYTESSWTRGLGTTFLFIVVGPFFSNLVMFWSLGVTLPVAPFFFLAALSALLSSIPLSFGNLGVKEGVYVLLFSLLGVSLEIAVAVVLVSRVLQLLLSLVALPAYFAKKY